MSRNMHRGRAPKSMGRTTLRVLKMLLSFYPVMLPTVAVCILVQCIVQALPNVFMERALTVVGQTWESGDWGSVAEGQAKANEAIKAGNDLIMPGGTKEAKNLLDSLHNGTLSREEAEQCGARIVKLIDKLRPTR